MSEILRYLAEMVTAIVINGIVLLMLIKRASARKLISNTFLINLLVADIITAVIGLVACVTHYTRMSMRVKDWDEAKMGLLFMYIFTSTLIILLAATILVTFDRFIAIVKPYRYKEMFSRRNVVKILTIIWLFGGIVLVIGLVLSTLDEPRTLEVAQNTLDVVLLAIAFAGILFLTIANSIIFREVRKQIKFVSSISVFGDDKEAAKKLDNSLRKKEVRAVYLCFTIVCVFVVCWLPFSLGLAFSRSSAMKNVGKHFMDVGKVLVFVGIILNPCIYVPFKSELHICKCIRKRSKYGDSMENQQSDRTEMKSYI